MERSKLNHCSDWVGKYCALISATLTGVLFIYLMLVITVDVIGRGFFSKPILIADASSGYALVGITFLGLAFTELAGKHVVVGILTRRLPSAKREQLEVAVLIVTLVFTIWLTWILFGVTKLNYLLNTVSQDALHIRMWIPHAVGPLGTGMFAIVLLTRVIQKFEVLVKSKDIK